MTNSEDASVRTVVVAVAVNLLTAVAKGVAAVLTGSAAMLAETTHSIADTANEVLLYVGVRHGARPADDRHPLGYGQARYFWSLLAAVGIFVIGGLLAILARHTTLALGGAGATEELATRTGARLLEQDPVSAAQSMDFAMPRSQHTAAPLGPA